MKAMQIQGSGPFYTNTYLLCTDGGHAVVIDPAASPAAYNEALQREQCTLTHIFLTHGHMDHVGSVEMLRRQWNATVYADPRDCQGSGGYPLAGCDCTYTDGGTITVDELTFTTWYTPGHSQGSWIILCGNLLFSGDTLFAGSIGRTDLPGGDYDQIMESLKKILRLNLPDDTVVLPGHERQSTMGSEKKYNFYLRGL